MTLSHGAAARGQLDTGRVKKRQSATLTGSAIVCVRARPLQTAAVEPRKAVPQPHSFLLRDLWTLCDLPIGEVELGPVFDALRDYGLTRDRQVGKGVQGAVWLYTWLTSTISSHGNTK
eukprot:229890-Rhodomonas_salina.1